MSDMEHASNIVAVKFQDKFRLGEFYGREYHYLSSLDVSVGDIVDVQTARGPGVAIVTQINVPESKVDERIMPLLKEISGLHKTESEEQICKTQQ